MKRLTLVLFLFCLFITTNIQAEQKPIVSMTTESETGSIFFLHLFGRPDSDGSVEIDYGDGELHKVYIDASQWVNVSAVVNDNKTVSIYADSYVLMGLQCSNNRLTNLDVSGAESLTLLVCSDNRLTELDISNNKDLKLLDVSVNSLTRIDLSNNLELESLDCSKNNLTALDLSANPMLEEVQYESNPIVTLNDPHNKSSLAVATQEEEIITMVTEGEIGSDFTLALSPEKSKTIVYVDYGDGERVETLLENSNEWISIQGTLKGDKVRVYGTPHAIVSIRCSGNSLTYLDVSKLTRLQVLDCSDNNLTQLSLCENTELRELECSYNQLSRLDVLCNINLQVLFCTGNPMKYVEVNNVSDVRVSESTKVHRFNEFSYIEIDIPEGYTMAPKSELENVDWYLYSLDGVVVPSSPDYVFRIEYFDEDGNQKTYPTLDCFYRGENVLTVLLLSSFDGSASFGIQASSGDAGQEKDNPLEDLVKFLESERFYFLFNAKQQLALLRDSDRKILILNTK